MYFKIIFLLRYHDWSHGPMQIMQKNTYFIIHKIAFISNYTVTSSKVQISNLSLVLFLAKSEILHVKAQDKRCIKALTGSEFLTMRSNKINCFLETLSTDEYLKNPFYFLTQEPRIKFWVLLNNTVDNTFFVLLPTLKACCVISHTAIV